MLTGAGMLFQRMRIEEGGVQDPNEPSVLGVEVAQSSVTEGVMISASIKRMGGRHDQPVTITYTWTSAAGAADLTAPLVTTVTIPANVLELAINMQTVARAGAQGNREVRVTLSNPVNCSILESNAFDVCTLADPVTAQAVIGAFIVTTATAIEGDVMTAQIRRVSGDAAATVLVDWEWRSSLGDGDFTPASVLSGQATISSSVSQVNASVQAALVTGLQGDRAVNFEITNVSNGQISTANPVAVFTLKDTLPPTPTTVGIFAASTADVPDDGSVAITMNLKRTSTDNNAVTVNYAFTSSLHTFDFAADAVTSGTATLGTGVNQTNISVTLRDRSAELQGDRTITCTISNPTVGTIGTATATNTLVDKTGDNGGGGPTDPGIPKYQPDVPVAKWHCVGFDIAGRKASYDPGRAGLVAALGASNYVPGDVIVLANGDYSGAKITISKNGVKTTNGSSHMMIRAKVHGMVSMKCQLEVTGKYVWITGVKFPTWFGGTNYEATGTPIIGSADGLWVTNCQCTAPAFLRISKGANVFNYRICYNSLLCDVPASYTDIGIIIQSKLAQSDWAPRDSDFAWNRVTSLRKASDSGEGHSRNFWILHPNHPLTQNAMNFCSQDCRIHHNHCVGAWSEIIYSKRNICAEFNYFEWANAYGSGNDFTYRQGLMMTNPQYGVGGIVRGNLFNSPNKLNMELNGVGITMGCNKKIGAGGAEIKLFTGTEKPNVQNGVPHEAADFAQIVDNIGFSPVTVGEKATGDILTFRGGTVNGTKVWKGDRGWNPTIDHVSGGSSVSGSPFNGYGTGLAVKVETITEEDLLNPPGGYAPVGWDEPGTTPPPPPPPPPPPTDDWWKLPIRSGRAWAAGTSFWFNRSSTTITIPQGFVDEEHDVALIDAICGSSSGGDSVNRQGHATWDNLIGGPIGGPLVSSGTNFDWGPTVLYGFGHALAYLPRSDTTYPDGVAWLVWATPTIPKTESTDSTNTATQVKVWNDIIAKVHDAKYKKWGERIKTKMAEVGHPLKRLLIDANHEMNQSNIYRIFPNTRDEYKAAMERTIDLMSEGAGEHLHFIHRPAYRCEPSKQGPYASYVPSNIDVLGLSMHPNSAVNSDANITKLFNGTLNADWYGTDEVFEAAATLDRPVAFPEWSPKNEADDPCPAADLFITRWHDDVIVPNASIIVCDCIFNQAMRDPEAYGGTGSGDTQWRSMVTHRKTLWSGTKN